jgi:hypothetical protein
LDIKDKIWKKNLNQQMMDMEEAVSIEDVPEEDYFDPAAGHIVAFVKDKFSRAETARQN